MLHAWVRTQDASLTADILRDRLARTLPAYMVPAGFSPMPEFPLKPSGKIDVEALPRPEALSSDRPYAPPTTPTEETVVAVWEKLLDRDRIGIHDNVFELGAHSLLVTRAVSELRSRLALTIPIKTIFEWPTPHDLAKTIDLYQWSTTASDDQALGEGEEEGEI